jgi:hypothetical protein
MAAAVSNITFLVVLAGMLLGSWRDLVDLFGSLALLAGFMLAVFAFAVGTLLATGPTTRRTTTGGLASVRNAGPRPGRHRPLHPGFEPPPCGVCFGRVRIEVLGASVVVRCGWQEQTAPSLLVGRHSIDHRCGDVPLKPPLSVTLNGANVDLDAMRADKGPRPSGQAVGHIVDEVKIHPGDATQ